MTSNIVVLNNRSVNRDGLFISDLVLALNICADTANNDMQKALAGWNAPAIVEDWGEVGYDIPLPEGRLLRFVWVRCVGAEKPAAIQVAPSDVDPQEVTITFGHIAPVHLTFRYTPQSLKLAQALRDELWALTMDMQAVMGGA